MLEHRTKEGGYAIPRSDRNADRVMVRRSLAKLQRYGLVYNPPPEKQRFIWVDDLGEDATGDQRIAASTIGKRRTRLIWRTPLGDQIVKHYAKELAEPGSRIRWDDRVTQAVLDMRSACPLHP